MTRQRLGEVAVVVLLLVAAVTALAAYRVRSAARPPEPAPAPSGPPPADRTDVPALPPFVLNVAFGPIDLTVDAGVGGNGPPVIVISGDPLEMVVRPERPIANKVTVRLFWRKQDRLRRWLVPAEMGAHSSYRYRGLAERPFGRGQGQLIAVISPVADVPDYLPAAWLERPPRHWQVLRQTVRWK